MAKGGRKKKPTAARPIDRRNEDPPTSPDFAFQKPVQWLADQPEPPFHQLHHIEDDGLGNIRQDLISGKTPAVRATDGGNLYYEPLTRTLDDQEKPDLIRVLIVHPASSKLERLECSIEISLLPRLPNPEGPKVQIAPNEVTEFWASLGKRHEYTALSYSWEGQTPTENIYIRGPSGRLTLNVTKNLKAALLQLRDVRESRTFWADAVYMNQDDRVEKSQQLPLMPRIYGQADRVCVWLGEQDPEDSQKIDTAMAFRLIKKIIKWQDYDTVVEKQTTCEEWEAFHAMMNRNWFSRRWIVQEIVLAGADLTELWWGDQHIPWIEFAQAVSLFEGGLRERVKKLYHESKKYKHHPDMYGEIKEFNASRLVQVTAAIVSRRDDGRVVQKRETLESLISTLTPFNTGQAHDVVYAVLSLAKDVSAGPPTVNLKAEMTPDDLLPRLRKDCKIHAHTQGSSTISMAIGFGTFIMIAVFIAWICFFGSTYLKLEDVLLYLDHLGVDYWIYGILASSLVITVVKSAEWVLLSIWRWLIDLSHNILDYIISLPYTLPTRDRRDTQVDSLNEKKSSTVQKVNCDCDRKVRVLNNVMRRLRLEKFPVDYTKGFDAVCDDLYTYVTDQSMSLDLICRPWSPTAPSPTKGPDGYEKWLPTWVRTLENRAFKADQRDHMDRVNADTLVGAPGMSPYQASGKYRSGWKFERDGSTQILSARGFQLDVIDEIADAAQSGSLPKKWLKHYRKPLSDEVSSSLDPALEGEIKKNVSNEFWRTMIAGKGPNGQNPPLSYELVCQKLLDSDDGINLITVRDREPDNDVLKSFINRVLSVIWNRTLARTSKLGRLALLPYDTRRGHVICILYGYSVPVVLEKTRDTTSTGEDIWELVGECYVYEMMAGEALAKRREKLKDDREFYKDRVFKIR
ncbi:hypothetical protein FKW77_006927 [Venturia effusa]|uniref:Heterokaryon incompatibility domain-containing protein n=1 Tax=Venturia effusa TaxID=50376 RepID=A0A517LLQ9_9PEZI|nr:hypothetical protein FKW77_006927 [Venturia effusa]